MMQTKPYQTILIICLGFLGIYLYKETHRWALYTSFAVGLSGAFIPFLRKAIIWLWMKLAELLGLIMPNIILTLFFYLILTPIALLSRLFGSKDPLVLKNSQASLFKNRTTDFEKSSFEKPW